MEALVKDGLSYIFDFESAKIRPLLDDAEAAIDAFKDLESHLAKMSAQLKRPVGRPPALTPKTLAIKLAEIFTNNHGSSGVKPSSRIQSETEHHRLNDLAMLGLLC